jgi:uncharacterized metal-binding protein
MNRLEIQRKILTVAAVLVLMPLLLMLALIPGAIYNPDPGANYIAIIIVMSVLGVLHLVSEWVTSEISGQLSRIVLRIKD